MKDDTAELTCWQIRLKIRGPLLTTSSAPMGFGIDAPFARNEAGELYLAGTLVKGQLKEAWQELSSLVPTAGCNWKSWIGREPPNVDADEPWGNERGILQFTDFVFEQAASSELRADVLTYRIERDPETLGVKRGQNLTIESPFASNGEYDFVGCAWGVVNAAEAQDLDEHLQRGLCFMPAIGAEVSVGFGVIAGVSVDRRTKWAHGTGWEDTQGDRWGIVLSPEGPICLAAARLAENIFESEAEITGGVMKGAIASLIQRLRGASWADVTAGIADEANPRKELCEEFSRIRVLHAKPVRKSNRKRPQAVPLSAVQAGEPSELRDVALREKLELVGGSAPIFQIDWKERSAAERHFGVIEPPRELRVRTQIETEKRRAKDENLFAYRMVTPRSKSATGAEEEYEWLGEIDFGKIAPEKRQKVKSDLAELLRECGMPGVGKLKTRCVVSRSQVGTCVGTQTDKGPHAGIWIITLQTPALLCDIEQVDLGLSDATDIYKAYWTDSSEGRVELVRHFATQRLAGGEYLWSHFSRGKLYRPFVLTDKGSTFVLKSSGKDDPREMIDRWTRFGIPIAKAVLKAFELRGDESDWNRCPYVTENGYGEVSIDQTWHWERKL